MKIALTGATGFIGKHVTNALLKEGYELLIIGNTAPAPHKNICFIQNDLLKCDDYRFIAQHRPTHLLHLAWYAEHGQFWHSTLNAKWCDATLRLVEAFCQQGGERVVLAGSCAEYDWSYGYCRENITPMNPATLYGISKNSTRQMAEYICHTYQVSMAWGRIFLLFGLGEHPKRLIPALIHALLAKSTDLSINIQHWRDFLPVEMVANAFLFLLKENCIGNFNICSGKPLELKEVVLYLANILDKDPAVIFKNAINTPAAPRFLVGDNTLLSSLGWASCYDIKTHLQCYAQQIALEK